MMTPANFKSMAFVYSLIMNRLISLQITDSVYRLTMLFTVLSYAANGEAVDSETDDRGTPLLMTEYAPIQKKT